MEQTLKYISETLKQKEKTVTRPGLMHGKMGIAIFFFHYAHFTGDTSFEDYAMELIESLQEQISQNHVYDYAEGLAGIGVGIEYLAQNKFVAVDTDEVLRDHDMLIFYTTVIGDHSDVTLLSGLSGTGRYLLFRTARPGFNNYHIPALNNKILLIHMTDYFERRIPSLKTNELDDVNNFLLEMNQANIYPVKTKRLLKILSSDSSLTNTLIHQRQRKIEILLGDKISGLSSCDQEKILSELSPGLYGGLAGIGLYLLSKLDKRHETWMNLI